MFCEHCGNQLEDGSKFCSHCGNMIESSEAEKIPPLVPPVVPPVLPPQKPKERVKPTEPIRKESPKSPKSGNGKTILIIVFAVLAALIIGGVAFWFLGGEQFLRENIPFLQEEVTPEDPSTPETIDDLEEKDKEEVTDNLESEDQDFTENNDLENIIEDQPEVIIESDHNNDPLIYFINHADTVYFMKEDIQSFNEDMCRLARNGIYARHGRKFEDENLTNYFRNFAWYNPTIAAEDFQESFLNEIEIHNRDLIVEYEKEQGYR